MFVADVTCDSRHAMAGSSLARTRSLYRRPPKSGWRIQLADNPHLRGPVGARGPPSAPRYRNGAAAPRAADVAH